jgi:hypothetical protein
MTSIIDIYVLRCKLKTEVNEVSMNLRRFVLLQNTYNTLVKDVYNLYTTPRHNSAELARDGLDHCPLYKSKDVQVSVTLLYPDVSTTESAGLN